MVPVGCGSCGAQVLVRKSSWQQTSVQWNAVARQRCTRRGRPTADGGAVVSDAFLVLCAPLRESIEAAVQQGALPVLDDEFATPRE
ncbi:ferredoxin [Mycolicibacterium thermoresistibile]